MDEGYLVVCATPIGNLGDVSPRLVETLRAVDLVYAEDTRRTAKLLAHIGVEVPTRSLFAGNEVERTAELAREVASGKKVALVSDAGVPTVSDPGAAAVRAVRDGGHPVTAVPGPSAVTMSLALSGMDAGRFAFEGFLPRKGAERTGRIEAIAYEERPVVVFASPHRIGADLEDLAAACGEDREVTVNRELTKLHEEVWVGTLGEAAARWGEEPAKGEITLVLGPAAPSAVELPEAVAEGMALVASGASISEAARRVADATGVSKREIYQALLRRHQRIGRQERS